MNKEIQSRRQQVDQQSKQIKHKKFQVGDLSEQNNDTFLNVNPDNPHIEQNEVILIHSERLREQLHSTLDTNVSQQIKVAVPTSSKEHKVFKKSLTSTSFESQQYIQGNLVFVNHQNSANNIYSVKNQDQTPLYDENNNILNKFIFPVNQNDIKTKKDEDTFGNLSMHLKNEKTNEKVKENQISSDMILEANKTVDKQQDESNLTNQTSTNQCDFEDPIYYFDLQKIQHKSQFSKEVELEQNELNQEDSYDNDKEKIAEKDSIFLNSVSQPLQIQIKSKSAVKEDTLQKQQSTMQSPIKFQNISGLEDNNKNVTFGNSKHPHFKSDGSPQQNLFTKSSTFDKNIQNAHFSPLEQLRIIGTVARSVSRFQGNRVNKIESEEQLDQEMDDIRQSQQVNSYNQDSPLSPTRPRRNRENTLSLAFNQVRMIELISELAERGHPEDVQDIMKILQKDPKKYIRSHEDPEHIINKLNSKNQNSSYLACKNGNLNIVQFLVKSEANFNIKSKVGGDIEEYPLQVAVRWNHREIVEFLLSQRIVPISQEQIQLSYAEAKTKLLKNIISKRIKKKPFYICC